MIQKLSCTTPNVPGQYDIEISRGIFNHQVRYLSSLASRFAIITDDIVSPLYGESLCKLLCSNRLDAYLFTFPHGEQNKTRSTKELLEDQLFEKGLGRDTCVIALGGGVVTDIAGYIAATYCRGLPLVMIPTTLLGMVDASIGGKAGVNVPYGKNLLGCIYQPKKVLIDPSTLRSLPLKELKNGVVEMIKHGLIADSAYFDFLEKHSEQIMGLDPSILEKAIFESCLIKKEIVEQDEKEQGKRRLLNFGHTVGHALEKLTHYSLSHGEAVAIGILTESYLAVQLGELPQNSLDRIRRIFEKYHLPLQLPTGLSVEYIMDAMSMDKKSLKGQPRFVIINEIGSSLSYDNNYCTHVELSLLDKALTWMINDLCSHTVLVR